MQVYAHLVNWSALIAGMWVQWIIPMFMWARATKEANRFENNYKASMQMVLTESESEKPELVVGRTDGVPSIENSSVQIRPSRRGLHSSKFLLEEHEDEVVERISNITNAFFDEDDPKAFQKVYNMQGYYSAT